MTKADRVVIVGDYSQAYVHDQTVQVRADQLVRGDRIIPIPTDDTLAGGGMVRGDVYEVQSSVPANLPGSSVLDGWKVRAFGGSMVTYWVKPGDTFHRIVTPHDPPTCNYCIYRTHKALADLERQDPRPFGHRLGEYIAHRSGK